MQADEPAPTNHAGSAQGAGPLQAPISPLRRWVRATCALSLPCAAAAVALLAEGAAAFQPPAGPALRAGVGGAVVRDEIHRGGLAVGPVWLGARQAPRTDRAGRTCVQNTGTPEGGGDGSRNNDNSEPSKNICRTLELAFRKVWLRLYISGADENYSAALKEFVQASVAAYDQGYSMQALLLELRRHELETGDPMVDKTVRLTDQERQTREVWLVLVYLTLHRVSYVSKNALTPPRPEDTLGLEALVESTCVAVCDAAARSLLRSLHACACKRAVI